MRRSLGTLAILGSLAACSESDSATVDVLAASSFTDVAAQLEKLIESELDVDVRFSFGSSGAFFEQLNQGAPASVVLTANSNTMERLVDGGLVETSVAIASNELIIVTADTSAGREIDGLEALAAAGDAIVVLCSSAAPCGAATDELLAGTGLAVRAASREPNVRATLTKVLLGEADAAIVYRTDALAHPELRSVVIDEAVNVTVTSRAANVPGDEVAAEIVELLGGPAAELVLREAGFEAP